MKNYLDRILEISKPYLKDVFGVEKNQEFIKKIAIVKKIKNRQEIITKFSEIYINFIKEIYQEQYKNTNKELIKFIAQKDDGVKLVWGDCFNVLRGMNSESVHLIVTSPPYYNAREYSQWNDLHDYLKDMRKIIAECYRVLDNHRVFVFNVGDIFDNDNLNTKSVWGKRRLPLGAYFIKIFEEEGFTFVDDFIWDKGEVQSERHKNGDKPYPFYQYPINCYEHILIFHKHRLDNTRYPCPVCGTLKVNGNTQSEIGLRSWECKNLGCFERSKSNRGKRFSLKTLMTQSSQKSEFAIPEEFVKKWRRDIIKFSPVIKINSKGENLLGHTAPFPVEIPEFAIKMFSYPGDLILDPFGGSFTSVIVAKKLKRIGVGIELNKEMFRDASIKNIQNNFQPVLFNGKTLKISEFNF
ncbi:restriction endonuclease [Candidatus Kuenenbacteria bacterium CG23_combo_of_CG06-09_8_20_14_all_36_9]|uniref:Methyltransferase n=1 Tax=Candidatus Kuenenbacteria bacterium CG10_big_fil_rev_8_21_14_0_10_36_11 TaxID=1974618 RepID=A0A2M6WA86_9BACT|nr:MAG: restriction endonuclease [Candidatus Kuenenbacteria bacterium CG23_combo_of_CG06-09_8_20_14_all_36_9]PIT89713.1 MAG: restriction endonuclease [Candidatus Kuenenbacteria bacterium CG10_big_fil_rev_8_21_14_0_10_36_11]